VSVSASVTAASTTATGAGQETDIGHEAEVSLECDLATAAAAAGPYAAAAAAAGPAYTAGSCSWEQSEQVMLEVAVDAFASADSTLGMMEAEGHLDSAATATVNVTARGLGDPFSGVSCSQASMILHLHHYHLGLDPRACCREGCLNGRTSHGHYYCYCDC
jgi:hypothetical protein